jgi:hypothetical protein
MRGKFLKRQLIIYPMEVLALLLFVEPHEASFGNGERNLLPQEKKTERNLVIDVAVQLSRERKFSDMKEEV